MISIERPQYNLQSVYSSKYNPFLNLTNSKYTSLKDIGELSSNCVMSNFVFIFAWLGHLLPLQSRRSTFFPFHATYVLFRQRCKHDTVIKSSLNNLYCECAYILMTKRVRTVYIKWSLMLGKGWTTPHFCHFYKKII